MNDEQTPPEASPPPPPESPPPPAPPPSMPAGGASPNRGIMIVLAYLWLLALVPLLVEKDDAEVQWHAKHGLVLFGAEIAAFFALSILGTITGFLSCIFLPLLQLAILGLHIVCIVKGLQGGRFQIPGLSEYANRL